LGSLVLGYYVVMIVLFCALYCSTVQKFTVLAGRLGHGCLYIWLNKFTCLLDLFKKILVYPFLTVACSTNLVLVYNISPLFLETILYLNPMGKSLAWTSFFIFICHFRRRIDKRKDEQRASRLTKKEIWRSKTWMMLLLLQKL
jgi:hypothetical protein